MSDYSIEQLQSALIQADAAGDTKSAQILADQIAAQQADSYAKIQPKAKESVWGDLTHGLGELVDNWIHEGVLASPATADFINNSEAVGIHPTGATADTLRGNNAIAALTPEPKTITGTLISMAPTMAAAIPGWEAGAESVAAALTDRATPKVIQWAAKGLGGTLGSDVTSGEEITPENLSAGTGANILMETLFHVPNGLKAIKALLAKNDADVLSAADHIGVTPTVGTVTNRPWVQTLEKMLSKVPGANAINLAHSKELETLASYVEQIKSNLGYVGSPNGLGSNLKQAVSDYLEKFKSESNELYDNVFKKIDSRDKIKTPEFGDVLSEIANRFSTEPDWDKLLGNKKIKEIFELYTGALEKTSDPEMQGILYSLTGKMQDGAMSTQTARSLKRLLNDSLSSPSSAFKDTSDADISRLLEALNKDIEGHMIRSGVGDAWRKAQDHYAAGRALYEQALKSVDMTTNGDNVYTALFGNQAGGFKPFGVDAAIALKETLTQEQWNQVAAEVVHRMGMESAGAAGAGGREFNPSTFLTNWNRLDSDAKELLFSAEHANDLNQLAIYSDALKKLGRQENHSNTAHHGAMWSLLTGAVISPIHGIPALIGVTGGAKLSSLLFTNPQAARLVVEAAQAESPNALQAALAKMVAISIAHPELAQAFSTLGGDKNN
ncbi:hypothetical protein ACSVMK_11375 [Salmonella enterica]|uniref:hypothetical protein n=1 Tax=Salmonella enterica TaxID=28901 RepID=UPI001DD2457D|nr:hypothetical protein [Salmonella enterica]EID3166153.1 hypothetical protein [Salmonella enterica]EID3173375.1 hypothetical protein [Salmonella enterica]EID3177907.1 hypothetical protein [Salmonella enterica]EID3198620.1 hypothetical protein [Salmonella enterica]